MLYTLDSNTQPAARHAVMSGPKQNYLESGLKLRVSKYFLNLPGHHRTYVCVNENVFSFN